MKNEKKSGVDIDLGNDCSQIAFAWAKKTFTNRSRGQGGPLMTVDGAFSNIMDFNGVKIGVSSDGIGTKIEIAERTGIYDTLGFDLIAMAADDLAANGIETVNLSNILDVDYLDSDIVNQLMKGLHDAAKFAGLVITGGEIAELGDRIGGYGERMHFNWCSTAIGILAAGRKIIDGQNVKPGDAVISLQSRGFRSNGFSLLRKIMEKQFGSKWHEQPYNSDKSWGEILLTPSLIYTPLIVKLIKHNFNINGIVHITGGGIIDNFSRVLKNNKVGANLDNLFEPLDFMKNIQELGDVDEETAYRLWNMGNGMLLIVDKNQANEILDFIKTQDYKAQTAGKIISEPVITIQTKGMNPKEIS